MWHLLCIVKSHHMQARNAELLTAWVELGLPDPSIQHSLLKANKECLVLEGNKGGQPSQHAARPWDNSQDYQKTRKTSKKSDTPPAPAPIQIINQISPHNFEAAQGSAITARVSRAATTTLGSSSFGSSSVEKKARLDLPLVDYPSIGDVLAALEARQRHPFMALQGFIEERLYCTTISDLLDVARGRCDGEHVLARKLILLSAALEEIISIKDDKERPILIPPMAAVLACTLEEEAVKFEASTHGMAALNTMDID
jgi:hypothetical protein